MAEIDPIDFRKGASHFVTGVTVATTLDPDGRPVGLTVNSFSTVSLEPPLVLFCLGRDSDGFDAFSGAAGYVVHVLASDQEALARRFATKGIDKFDQCDWEPGIGGLPVLTGTLAVFECDVFRVDEGGDHLILLGEVRRLRYQGEVRGALGYFRGGYIEVSPSGLV